MKQTDQKLDLTSSEKFYHYSILLFIAVLPVMSAYYLFQIHVTGDYTGPRKPENFYIIGGIGILLMTLFYVLQNRRLRFRIIDKKVDYRDVETAVGQCSFELEWNIVSKNANKIVATRKNSFAWGERITIIIEPDRILINSICDPNKMTSIASLGHNRENIECFTKRINERCT